HFSCKIRTLKYGYGVAWIIHVLWPLPAVVIIWCGRSIETPTNLCIDFVNFGGRRVEGQEQVISAPFDEFSSVLVLIQSHVLIFVFQNTPTKHCHGKRHGKVKLYVVPCIIVSSNQSPLHICVFSII
ncbi:hypothetical protein V8G54_033659, partial [Vigna mungo]